jgi:hypothetical protein
MLRVKSIELRKFTVVCAAFFILVLNGEGYAQDVSPDGLCIVDGSVLDVLVKEALMPGMTISFAGLNKMNKTVTSDSQARYKIFLPSGNYSISLGRSFVKPIFVRSKLRLRCPDRVTINFYPFPEYSAGGLNFRTEVLSAWAHSGISPTVSYRKKKVIGATVVYDLAIFSFNRSTLFADRISISKGKILVDRVNWLENGHTRTTFRKNAHALVRFDQTGLRVDVKGEH